MKKIEKRKKYLQISIVILIILLILMLIIKALIPSKQENTVQELSEEVIEQERISEQKNMTERDRIESYFLDFMDYIENKEYSKAYNLLYNDYKLNYFSSLDEFESYMKEYFPNSSTIDIENIERIGKGVYVLWVNIGDLVNGEYGNNFAMNVVIKEEGYNTYKLSFSKDSAIKTKE